MPKLRLGTVICEAPGATGVPPGATGVPPVLLILGGCWKLRSHSLPRIRLNRERLSECRKPGALAGRQRSTYSVRYDVQYEFIVHGESCYSAVQTGDIDRHRVPIHYDPLHPEENLVGPFARPWTILVSALGIGAFLALIGYLARRQGN